MSSSAHATEKKLVGQDQDPEQYESSASASSGQFSTVENTATRDAVQGGEESENQESSGSELDDTAQDATTASHEQAQAFSPGPLHPQESAMARLCQNMGINYTDATPDEQRILHEKMCQYTDAVAARDKAANAAQAEIEGLMGEMKAVGQVVADRQAAEAEADAEGMDEESG